MGDFGAKEHHRKTVSEVRNVSVSFASLLSTAELLTGTPTITEDTTTALTLDNKRLSTSILTINDRQVAIGAAALFRVAGGVAGGQYTISLQVGTDATPAQTLHGDVTLDVGAD